MEREPYSDEDAVEREIEDTTRSPEETEGNMHDSGPYPPPERAQAVYGDTDMDPNRDDQRSAHHADSDEHL